MLGSKTVYGLLLLLAICWFAASLLPPFLAFRGELFWAVMSRNCFSAVCHQLPERSFALWGWPLAVCARCSGIYGGLIVGLVIYPFARRFDSLDMPSRSYLLIALGPTAIDFLL